MSDGISDAKRDDKKVLEVELAAVNLRNALEATGDKMFWEVNPGAVYWANKILKEIGLELKEKK